MKDRATNSMRIKENELIAADSLVFVHESYTFVSVDVNLITV